MRLAPVLLAVGSLVAVPACGDDDGGTAGSGGCRRAEDGRVTIVAKGIAWDTDCLEAPAAEPLTIVIDNQDRGVPHNLHLTDAPDEPETELENGPVVQELDVTLDEGSYAFVCDVHPNMAGTLTMLLEAVPLDT